MTRTDPLNIPVVSFHSIARSASRLTRSINQDFTSASALFRLAAFDPLAEETRIDTRAGPFSNAPHPRRSAPPCVKAPLAWLTVHPSRIMERHAASLQWACGRLSYRNLAMYRLPRRIITVLLVLSRSISRFGQAIPRVVSGTSPTGSDVQINFLLFVKK